jgi:hypothetical protein
MKKTAASLAMVCVLGTLSAMEMPQLTLDAKLGFESEHVSRGRKEGNQNFQLAAEVGTEVVGGHAYVGASSSLFLRDTIAKDGTTTLWSASANQVSPYIGYSHDLMGRFTLDAGYIAHLYTNFRPVDDYYGLTGDGKVPLELARNTNELYFGATADIICSPRVYFSYDVDREEFCLSGSIGYTYDLGQFGMNRFAVDGKLELGYDYGKRPFGLKDYFKEDAVGFRQKKDYFFYTLGADIVYKYNEQASLRAGARYAGNSASEHNWNNAIFGCGHKDMIWFTSAVEFSF